LRRDYWGEKGSELIRICLAEIGDRKRKEKELTGWVKERGKFWEEREVK